MSSSERSESARFPGFFVVFLGSMVERILLPNALGDGESPIEVPMLRRFDTQLGQSWQERIDQTDELNVVTLSGELEEFFDGAEIFTPSDFYGALRNATYEDDEGNTRTALDDAEESLRNIHVDARFDLYDLWWTRQYAELYVELQIDELVKPDALFRKIAGKMKMTKLELRRRLRRDTIEFLKSLFLEWSTASRKGEVEVMVLGKALGGNLQAAEMFRKGFNTKRAGVSKHVLDINKTVDINIDGVPTDELKELIQRERKLAGAPAALPMGEMDDDQESESEGTESERVGGGVPQTPQDERDDQ